MGRYSKNPTLLDEVIQIKISDFKKLALLNIFENDSFSRVINWRSKLTKEITSSITVIVSNGKYLFNYSYRGEDKTYYVDIHKVISNLGKGFIYYFICPISKRKCRNLYLVNGIFSHHSAVKGAFYSKQIESKRYREWGKIFANEYLFENTYFEIFKKYRKKSYKGKPTKWYTKFQRICDLQDFLDLKDIDSVLIRNR